MGSLRLQPKSRAILAAQSGDLTTTLKNVRKEWKRIRKKGLCYRNHEYSCPNNYNCQPELEDKLTEQVKQMSSQLLPDENPFAGFTGPFDRRKTVPIPIDDCYHKTALESHYTR